jgi:hypothetical protein
MTTPTPESPKANPWITTLGVLGVAGTIVGLIVASAGVGPALVIGAMLIAIGPLSIVAWIVMNGLDWNREHRK